MRFAGSSIGSNGTKDLTKRSIAPQISESKMEFETESSKTAKSKYTTVSGVAQINYASHKVTNPFEKLLIANESFTYHKPHYGHLSQNTILEEDETDYEYDELEGITVSTDNLRNNLYAGNNNTNQSIIYNSYSIRKNPNSGIINNLLGGKFEQEVSITGNFVQNPQRIDGTTMTTLQGQGDSNAVDESFVLVDENASISIKINFAFYAKLLAFLLTINTVMFFKTFILSNILNYLLK